MLLCLLPSLPPLQDPDGLLDVLAATKRREEEACDSIREGAITDVLHLLLKGRMLQRINPAALARGHASGVGATEGLVRATVVASEHFYIDPENGFIKTYLHS